MGELATATTVLVAKTAVRTARRTFNEFELI